MHPEFARRLADQHHADLVRVAARARRAASPWRAARTWRAVAARWLPPPGRARLAGGAAGRVPEPAGPAGIFLDGTEAHGFQIYLTPAEARRLARDCSRLAGRYADRLEDPRRRPAGAMPVEVVVLSRRLPEPAGAGRGLPGPGSY